jgi:hypothetical protein
VGFGGKHIEMDEWVIRSSVESDLGPMALGRM